MAIDYTMDGIIADVKRGAAVPTNQSLFNETDFVAVLSDDMKTVIVPLILSAKENFFLTKKDTTIVSGTQSYETPWRAIGNSLKTVRIVDSDGEEQDLPRIDIRDTDQGYLGDYMSISGYRLEGNNVVLYPDDNWIGKSIRMYYYRRPNDLVPTSEAGKVVAITTLTKEVQLDNVPTTWTTSDTFDCITAKPPFSCSGEDHTISAINGFVLTFDTLPTGLAVGDWVCHAGESTIPQIPYDAFPLLAQRGVCMVLGTLSPQAADAAEKTYAQLHQAFLKVISPRVDDAPKRAISRKGIWTGRGRLTWPS